MCKTGFIIASALRSDMLWLKLAAFGPIRAWTPVRCLALSQRRSKVLRHHAQTTATAGTDLALQYRPITNATKIDHVESLRTVRSAPAKLGGWRPTLVHSSGEVKFTVIRVEPGGEVPRHFHHDCWDYFVPLEGEGSIETKAQDGEERSFVMEAESFLAVPPRDIHRVRNASNEKEFVFLLAQSPRHKYDFVEA